MMICCKVSNQLAILNNKTKTEAQTLTSVGQRCVTTAKAVIVLRPVTVSRLAFASLSKRKLLESSL